MKNLYSVSLYFIGLLSLSTCCLNDNALEDNQEQIPVSFFLNEREVVNLNKTKNTDIPEDNEKEIVIVTDKSEWKQKALSDLRTTWVTGASGISNLAWKQGDEMGIYI